LPDRRSRVTVALVTPQAGHNQYYFDFSLEAAHEELGLGYLASSVSAGGHTPTILDGPAMQLDSSAILAEIMTIRPAIVGLSLINQTLAEGEYLAREIKRERPETCVVVGGHLPTNAPIEVLQGCAAFDVAILGYGEQTLVEVCDRFAAGKGLADVQGVAYRENGAITRNGPRPLPSDLDCIPFPDRSAVKCKVERGLLPLARVVTSRGCPYECNYCTTPAFLDAHELCGSKRWMPRSPENVVEEISGLVSSLGVKVIIFCDDEFVARVQGGTERVLEIARMIKERELPIRFWAMFRVDDFAPDDDVLVAELKQAGLWGVFLGVEAGADSQLKTYGKGTSVTQNRTALELFRRHNILVEMGSITFHPEVTFEELSATGSFLAQEREASLFRYFSSRLAIYPGEHRLVKRLESKGLLLPTFSYRNEFAYNFSDPSIGVLADALTDASRHFEPLDMVVWNARRVAQILGDMVTPGEVALDRSTFLDLASLRGELSQIDAAIGHTHHQCFCECLRVAARDGKREDIDTRLRLHAKATGKQVTELKRLFRRLGRLRKEWLPLRHSDILERMYDYDYLLPSLSCRGVVEEL